MPRPNTMRMLLFVSMFAVYVMALSIELYIRARLFELGQVQTNTTGIITGLAAITVVVAATLAGTIWLYWHATPWGKRFMQYEAQRRQQFNTAKKAYKEYVRQYIE